MASKRLEQETVFEIGEHGYVLRNVVMTCETGECEFLWPEESDEGDVIPLPSFCPICGRRAK